MEKKELFQQAKDCLEPTDIYLRDSKLTLADGYEPKYYSAEVGAQFRYSVIQMEESELEEESGEASKIFRVLVNTGVRVVDVDINKIEDQSSEEAKKCVKAELIATFVAEYKILTEDLSVEAMTEFGERNVKYHIWPFWREYILNTFQRTQMPRVMLPTFQL